MHSYGEEITSTAGDTYKFAQTYRDSDSGLDYANQRYYGSSIGRFLTADPYKAKTGGSADPRDPSTWNLYAYSSNDPVNKSDPDGLLWIWVGSAYCTVGAGEGIEVVPCDYYANVNVGYTPKDPVDPTQSPAWIKALAKLSNGNSLLHNVLGGTVSKPCQQDLDALASIGVLAPGITAAADMDNWNPAKGSTDLVSGLFVPGS